MTRTLTCSVPACGNTWEHEGAGRPGKYCPTHRHNQVRERQRGHAHREAKKPKRAQVDPVVEDARQSHVRQLAAFREIELASALYLTDDAKMAAELAGIKYKNAAELKRLEKGARENWPGLVSGESAAISKVIRYASIANATRAAREVNILQPHARGTAAKNLADAMIKLKDSGDDAPTQIQLVITAAPGVSTEPDDLLPEALKGKK